MRRKSKTLIIIALCIGICAMAVGYSVLMTELKIKGTANITSTWDVRITGISKGTSTGSAYNIETPSYTNTTAKFNVSLVNPGDSMTYSVTIQNKGTVTALLSGMTITTSGTDAIEYTVSGLKEGDTIAASATKTVTVVAKYKTGYTADPHERAKKLNVDLEWVQYSYNTVANTNYDIVYNTAGATNTISNTSCIAGSTCAISSSIPVKDGYAFLGWSLTDSGSATYNPGDEVSLSPTAGKVTLYATWGQVMSYPTYGAYDYTVTASGYYRLEAWGAQGGYRTAVPANVNYAGKGGYAKGEVYLEAGTVLHIFVGGSGNVGGFNGGGASGCNGQSALCGQTILFGGGASDIRVEGNTLNHRILVAGGGGSTGGIAKKGGAGGGNVGASTSEDNVGGECSATVCGQGGNQTQGGAGASSYANTAGIFGQGGQGYALNDGFGGGGGGGWYGGSGSVPDDSGDDDRGGGGGSGYVLTSDSVKPSEYQVGEKYYMFNTLLVNGDSAMPNPDGGSMVGRLGSGFVRITRLF